MLDFGLGLAIGLLLGVVFASAERGDRLGR